MWMKQEGRFFKAVISLLGSRDVLIAPRCPPVPTKEWPIITAHSFSPLGVLERTNNLGPLIKGEENKGDENL